MELRIQTIHFELQEETRTYIEERVQRIKFAHKSIVHLEFMLRYEAHQYELECKIHFRWGAIDVIKLRTYELHEGLNNLLDRVQNKITKETAKIQEH